MRSSGRQWFKTTLLAAAAMSVCSTLASAAALTPGNLIVLRDGDGTTTLSTAAAPVTLLEFTTAGALTANSIPVPSTGGSALTLRGDSTTEGILNFSANNQYLTFGGYRRDANATDPSAVASTTSNRVIGRLSIGGVLDTSTALTDAFSADSFRSVVSQDGTTFYTSGAGASVSSVRTGGVRYVSSLGATTSTTLNNTTGNPSYNTRQIDILGGNLYVGAGAAAPGQSVFKFGTGLPTTGPNDYVASFPVDATGQFETFFFADLTAQSWLGSTFDTLYASDTSASLLRKYTFNGTSWVAAGTLAKTNIGQIVGVANGSSVTLYGTTKDTGGTLFSFTDTGAPTDPLAGTFNTLASAGSNFAFRGIEIVPAPEPATFGLLAFAGLFLRRRSR